MRRLLPVLIGIVVVVGGGLLLLTVVHGRDAAGVGEGTKVEGPGTLEANKGDAVRDGAGVGKRAVPPPTSGAHAQRTPTREGPLDDAQLLTALALGDVVIAYDAPRPPAALTRLQEEVAGAFDPELAAAGQAVILVRRPGLQGVQALSWRRRLEAAAPDDAQLRSFADAWIGQGADASG